MKIKLESSNSQNIPTLKSLQKKILEDIKRIRSGNNAQQNCMHLANYIVELIPHYLFGSEKPKKPSTSTSSSIAASYLYSTFIKKENIPTETTVNYAVNHGDNPLPPSVIPVINEEGATENEIHDLVSDVRRTTVANFITLQNQLVNSITDETQFTYGSIALANKTNNAPGHILAYLASKDQVLYIDPQFYDGEAKKGDPIFEFSEFFDHYNDDFKQEVYYLQYGKYNTPQLSETHHEETIDTPLISSSVTYEETLPNTTYNTKKTNESRTKHLVINLKSLKNGLLNDIREWSQDPNNSSFEQATQYALGLIERHVYGCDKLISQETSYPLSHLSIPIDKHQGCQSIVAIGQAIDNMHKKLSNFVTGDIPFAYGTILLTDTNNQTKYSLAYLANKRNIYYINPMRYKETGKPIFSSFADFYANHSHQFTDDVCFIDIYSYDNSKFDQRNDKPIFTFPFNGQNTIYSTDQFKKRPLLATLLNNERPKQTSHNSATDLKINTIKEQSMRLSLSTTSEMMREISTYIQYIIIEENISIEIIKLIPDHIIQVAFLFTDIPPEIISALPETVKRIFVRNDTPIGCLMPAMAKGLLINISGDQKYTFSIQNEINSPLNQSLSNQTFKTSTSRSRLIHNSIFPPNSTSDGMIEEPHAKRVRPSENEKDNSNPFDL